MAKTKATYEASHIKRAHATRSEMEERAVFLLAYAAKHGPLTVRGLYYAGEVAGLPGINKDDGAYSKIQRQVLSLRRSGRMPYSAIADATRWMRLPQMHNSVADALTSAAHFYRRNLWADHDHHVEIWVEKDALAGVIMPVTREYGVPLMVCRGFTSETFASESANSYITDGRPVYIYHLGDFDRSGVAAALDLENKLKRFTLGSGIDVHFERLAVTPDQIRDLKLPTREPKRKTAADRKWPHTFACELDAIPPDMIRSIVRAVLSIHMPDSRLVVIKAAEHSEREFLGSLVDHLGDARG
jgi:hypothetical protein